MIRHHANLVPSWNRLHEAALAGLPVRGRSSHGDHAELEDFLMGMHGNSLGTAARAAREIDLGGRRHLLDLGGGPGTWSAQFVLANPGLRATVFDLPTTRPFAERVLGAAGVADRVSFRGRGLHRGRNPLLLRRRLALAHPARQGARRPAGRSSARAVRALTPGGLILVHEFILDDDRTSPQFPALFSLNMLSGTPEGRSYTVSELAAMLDEAGVREPLDCSLSADPRTRASSPRTV